MAELERRLCRIALGVSHFPCNSQCLSVSAYYLRIEFYTKLFKFKV